MLHQSCDQLTGVGPAITQKLQRCGIHTLRDLLFHLPYRYQDRTRITPIQDLRLNDWCVVVGRVIQVQVVRHKRKTLSCTIEDASGQLVLRFFHFYPQQVALLQQNPTIRVFGEVRKIGLQMDMIHPDYQIIDADNICPVEEHLTPIYSTSQGLTQKRLRQLVQQAMTQCEDKLHELEWLKPQQRDQLGLQSIRDALQQLHNPPPDIALSSLESGHHPGLKRLAFDELMAKQLSLQFARQQRAQHKAPVFTVEPSLFTAFLNNLSFTLTSAQQRVYQEIQRDLANDIPMLRLVQGDVGSGKTVIAALAALQVIAQGYQVAIMAPTEILSEQHAQSFKRWFEPLGFCVVRLSGQMKIAERRATLSQLQNKTGHIVIGTHALFQDEVSFAQLGLIIIDEQHRFGVAQRFLLQQKGALDMHQLPHQLPHQLIMTATPIPRTLAMAQLTHLDLSILDELPPGRTPIITAVVNQQKRDHIIERLQHGIQQGRQVYWVCTLIDESEHLQCMAAIDTCEALQAQLPHVRIGLVHGRLKKTEKEAIMQAFKQGDLDLLVATLVIEVGVDVPNASLMIIENAERLGLSQLHQLRGRVGRGQHQSHCLLVYQGPLSMQAQARLRLMKETTDGFLIAEKDLQWRGAGQILGTQQTGYQPFKIANLPRDEALLEPIYPIARDLLTHQPELASQIAQRWLPNAESFVQV